MRVGCAGRSAAAGRTFALDEGLVFSPAKSTALVALDDALKELAAFDPHKAQVVELSYFGGMSMEETAEVLGVHPTTVNNVWRMARIWLKHELSPKGANGG
jgi:DNA-directed RNA polymerase specialized sigma24 family protein